MNDVTDGGPSERGRSVPGAAQLADTINRLGVVWDDAVREHGANPAFGSMARFDMHEFEQHSHMPRAFTSLPAGLLTPTCSSVLQVARSIGALYAACDTWGLTLGHLPAVRSVLEGAGQVRWIAVGDDPIDAPSTGPTAWRCA